MLRTSRLASAALVVLVGLVIGLSVALQVSAAKTAVDPGIKRGQQVYTQYCAACHGPDGKGDGVSGQNLPIKPQDLTEGRLINPLPNHFLATVIARGGQAVGLSPLMPGFKPYLSDEAIRDVIAYIRSLAAPAYDPKDVLPVATKREGPVQPIFFSHVIHAGSFRLDCQYCHAGARRSSAAGIPSVERCMGCHKITAAQGNPEVQKLHGYWARKEPIPWVRIFKIPEYVHFPHKNHVQAGLPCQTCHGRIEAMEQVHAQTGQSILNDVKNLALMPAPPNKLTMGWCVECHRAANGNNLAGLSWIGSPVPKLTVRNPKAPLDCVTCHH